MSRKTSRGGEADDELYTPAWLLDWFADFGQFDLDPCWSPMSNSLPKFAFDINTNGFTAGWGAYTSAWVNFPYSATGPWLGKCRQEADENQMLVVALTPAKIGETAWSAHVWHGASKARCVLPGRVKFDRPPGFDSTPGTFNSALVFWGPDDLVEAAVASVKRLSQGHRHEPIWLTQGE